MKRLLTFALSLLACLCGLYAQARSAGPPPASQDKSKSTAAKQSARTSASLIDVNLATNQELQGLGLAPMDIERFVQGRPYKDKTELLSRHILNQALYNKIQGKLGPAPSNGATRR